MCGIAGIRRLDGRAADQGVVEEMCRAIAHRGPDDHGIYLDGEVGLGHRRLSVIDLTPSGHQPMSLPCDTLWITYNGELYNYRELRHELEARGVAFRTASDTEVVLRAWEQWGEAALSRFIGMWAFALWDRRRRRLTLCRDQYGIKPLYWCQTKEHFGFASEMKGLLPVLPNRTPDLGTLYQLAVFQLRTAPDATCVSEIRQVPPGGLLHFDGDRLEARRWYTLPAHDADDPGDPATLRRLLEESLTLHLRSDVPVGACLSGGIDSSALVALTAQRVDYPLHTFSVTYPGTPADESRFVTAVRDRVPGLVPHETTPLGEGALASLDRIAWHFEEPVWGEASYSWWSVMELVAAHGIKVVVNGQGADELFAGYPYYYPSYLRQLLRGGRLPTFVRELRAEAAHQGTRSADTFRSIFGPVWPLAMRRMLRPLGVGASWNDEALGPALREVAADAHAVEARRGHWSLDAHLRGDLTVTRLPMLLQAEDRFSMAFSIESRVPFVTPSIVEWATRVRASRKLHRGVTKLVLREAVADLLPSEVRTRADKKGYNTPAPAWFRTAIGDEVADRLASNSVRDLGLLHQRTVQQRFEQFRTGKGPLPEVWRWLTLQSWGERFAA